MFLQQFLNDLTVLSIVLFLIGIILLVIEMFHPGFGLAGILGVILLVADIFITAKTFQQGLILTAVCGVLFLVIILIGARLASKGKLPKFLVLKEATDGKPGDLKKKDYIGKIGITETELRPAGIVSIDGVRMDVISTGEFIKRGEKVEVVETDGNRIVVASRKQEADI
jgi:membrane-bound ClpP family serine protease